MRSFLLNVMPVMLWVFVVLETLFLVLFFTKYSKTKNILFLLSGLVTAGLVYDALILSMGTVLKDGALLKSLSQFRFISHGALIPMLFPICLYALKGKGTIAKVVWGFTALLCVLGLAEGIVTDLEVRSVAEVYRYAASDLTPVWADKVSSVLSFGTVIPLMIVGVIVWKKQKTAALFFSGFWMFFFSALGPATGNFDLLFFISMMGELLMVLFLYIYALKTEK